jgi:hypothetical protein
MVAMHVEKNPTPNAIAVNDLLLNMASPAWTTAMTCIVRTKNEMFRQLLGWREQTEKWLNYPSYEINTV